MRACPHYKLENWLIIHTFYNDLFYNTRITIDVAIGGALMNKPFNDAYALIKNLARNHYQWGNEHTPIEKTQTRGRMYEVSSFGHMNVKVDTVAQKIDNLSISLAATVTIVTPNCGIYGVLGHIIAECQLLSKPTLDQVNYTQVNPYSNTYNLRWRNHPNFSYKNNNMTFAPSPAPHTAPLGL